MFYRRAEIDEWLNSFPVVTSTRMSTWAMAGTLARTADGKLTDISIPVRFSLLAAASNADEGRWREKTGEYLTGFAYALPPGAAIPNFLIALQLMGDFAPSLKPHLIRASSYAMLANDAVTPVTQSDAKCEAENSADTR